MSRTKRRFLWITDPWDTLDHASDTTLRLADEALQLGHESHWCDVRSIRMEGSEIRLDAWMIEASRPAFRLGIPVAARPSDFDSLHFRVDPPVDLTYLHPLQILVLGLPPHFRKSRRRAELVNSASLLFGSNEKLEATLLGPLMPPSIASSRWDDLSGFGARHGVTVLKPLHFAQSKGVELIDWNAPNGAEAARLLFGSATDGFSRPVLLQKFLPGIEKRGETRLWFLDGKLLASARKLPLTGDFRVNIDRGSRLEPANPLQKREKQAVARIGRHLRMRKIRLAAIDLIDGYVTDFNFTSPGLIAQMERLLGRNLAKPIVQALALKSWS